MFRKCKNEKNLTNKPHIGRPNKINGERKEKTLIHHIQKNIPLFPDYNLCRW